MSFSSWKFNAVKDGGFTIEMGPWMPAIEPAPPVEPILTVVMVGKLAELEILTVPILASTLTVLGSLVALPVATESVLPVPVPLTLIVSSPASPLTPVATPLAVLLTSMTLLPWLA